jgi:CheY-like chemotaxis protein
VVVEALASLQMEAELTLAPGLVVQADPVLLTRVLTELLENAREAGGVGVDISSRLDGERVEIAITDRGEGVSAELLPRMFDPFVTTQARGRGLGLSIVESLMRVHDGTVQHSVPEGGGASFALRMVGEMDAPSPGAESVLRVLVMDDEDALREILADMIQLLGHEVDTAACGEEALDKFERAHKEGLPYGLVLLDLVVPAGDGGLEILHRLRQQAPGLRAIVSSGYWAEATTHLSPSGFQAALIKPFTLQDVRTAVEQALNSGSD